MTRRRLVIAVTLMLASSSCARRLQPLPGTPAPVVLPRAALPAGHHRIVFRWELEDPDIVARGEGAARTAGPDSARLDFFLGGGVGGGAAVLVGERLDLPPQANDMSTKLVPPAPLLWASLGRLALPPTADTSVRVQGDTLRADLGSPVVWRVTFVHDTLTRLERVGGGRVLEWVERSEDGRTVRYSDHAQRRRLDLFITRSEHVSAFDPAIWTFR